MLPKILATPFGGHASSLLLKIFRRRLHPRPDYPFSYGIDTYDIHSLTDWDEVFYHETGGISRPYHRARTWQQRTGLDPQPDKTIHENLMGLIENTPYPVLMFGKCSLSETWLTNNEFTDALFIVRNPLDEYDSFFGRRHPQWADAKGGVQSITAAEFYCEQWNKVVYDFLCSHYMYNTPIVRFESLVQDLEEAGLTDLARVLKPQFTDEVKREFITPEIKECIEDLTCKHYLVLYEA